MDFQFDETSHVYSRDGQIIPGCTRILDFSGLVDYSMVRDDVLARKSMLGKVVHTCTHFYDDNDLDWSTVAEEAKPRVNAWIEFRLKTGFVPRRRELQMIATLNGMLYGMQIDADGLLFKQETIVDIKTRPTMWYDGVQLAGYMAGLPFATESKDAPMSNLARWMRRDGRIVELKKDGRFKLSDPYRKRADYDAFASGLFLTHYKMAHGKQIPEIAEAA
jgi:hypothetical protein